MSDTKQTNPPALPPEMVRAATEAILRTVLTDKGVANLSKEDRVGAEEMAIAALQATGVAAALATLEKGLELELADNKRLNTRIRAAEREIARVKQVKDCYYECVGKDDANQQIASLQDELAAAQAEIERLNRYHNEEYEQHRATLREIDEACAVAGQHDRPIDLLVGDLITERDLALREAVVAQAENARLREALTNAERLLALYPEWVDDAEEGYESCVLCDGGGYKDGRRRLPIRHRPDCPREQWNQARDARAALVGGQEESK